MLTAFLQMVIVLLLIVIAFVGSSLFFLFMGLAYKSLKADKFQYRQMSAAGSVRDALKGTITPRDGVPSYLIREGLAIDKRNKKIVPQGTLSDDALNSMLK